MGTKATSGVSSVFYNLLVAKGAPWLTMGSKCVDSEHIFADFHFHIPPRGRYLKELILRSMQVPPWDSASVEVSYSKHADPVLLFSS